MFRHMRRSLARGSLDEWVVQPQALKAAVVAIGRDPLAARFDCQRGEVCVRDEVASCSRLEAEAREDRPVARAWLDEDAVRARAENLRELERRSDRCRSLEHTGMRDNPEEPTHHEVEQTERSVRLDSAFEPPAARFVLGELLAKCVDEDVDVRREHRARPSGRPGSRCRRGRHRAGGRRPENWAEQPRRDRRASPVRARGGARPR